MVTETRTTPDGRTVVHERRTNNTGWLVALLVVVALVVAAFAFGLIDIDQTREAKVPEVTVETSGGQAPAFDVETADVDVGTKSTSVDVPTVDVDTTKAEIAVPTIDVKPADSPNAKND